MGEVTQALDLWFRRLERRSALTQQDRHMILALPATFHSFANNRDIVRQGEETTQACLVASGVIGRFSQNADGYRQITAVYIPGDMGDLHSVVLPKSSSSLTALGQVELVKVPHAALRLVAQQSVALGDAFWRECTVDAQIASEWVFALGRLNATRRLAHFLCEIGMRYEQIGFSRTQFPLALTQTQIGDATGLTAVHVNRTLRRLRTTQGLEIVGGMIRVPNWSALVGAGEFKPDYLHLEAHEAPLERMQHATT